MAQIFLLCTPGVCDPLVISPELCDPLVIGSTLGSYRFDVSSQAGRCEVDDADEIVAAM